MSLFDTQDLAEITHPDYPGERLIACRNPDLAQLRAAKRDSMLAATEALLATLTTRVQAGRLAGADAIGVAVGKVIDKYSSRLTDDRSCLHAVGVAGHRLCLARGPIGWVCCTEGRGVRETPLGDAALRGLGVDSFRRVSVVRLSQQMSRG
ncbi:MAG: hypothetical protein ACRDQU_13950 [Pseudonocardiaceae bacterium]